MRRNAIAHMRRHRGEDVTSMERDRKSTRLNSSHSSNSYAVFCLKKKTDEYLVVSVDLQLQQRWPTDHVALRHFECQRRTPAHGQEPAAQVGASGAGGRVLEDGGAIRKKEPSDDFLATVGSEDVGLSGAIHAAQLLEHVGQRACPPHRRLAFFFY